VNLLLLGGEELNIVKNVVNKKTLSELYTDINIFVNKVTKDLKVTKEVKNEISIEMSELISKLGVSQKLKQKKIVTGIKNNSLTDKYGLSDASIESIKELITSEGKVVSNYLYQIKTQSERVPTDISGDICKVDGNTATINLSKFQVDILREVSKNILDFLDIKSDAGDVLDIISKQENVIRYNLSVVFSSLHEQESTLGAFGVSVKKIMNFKTEQGVLNLVDRMNIKAAERDIKLLQKMLLSNDSKKFNEIIEYIQSNSAGEDEKLEEMCKEFLTSSKEIKNVKEQYIEYILCVYLDNFLNKRDKVFLDSLNYPELSQYQKYMEFVMLRKCGFTGFSISERDNIKNLRNCVNFKYIDKELVEEILQNSNIQFIFSILSPILEAENKIY